MKTAIPAPGATSWIHRSFSVTATLLLLFGFAQTGLAQTGTPPPPLSIFKNYFVTGDYVVAGWVEGPPDGSGLATLPFARDSDSIAEIRGAYGSG